MKNQSFHPRKIRLPETAELDDGKLKGRTIIALNKLGEQKFSTEPGGYSLDSWTRGVNILLDEFEEKLGAAKLSTEYSERRRRLNERLSQPVSTSSIDKDISELRQSITDIESRINGERTRLAQGLSALKSEQDRCSADLLQEQESASSPVEDQSSGSVFKRLFGRNRNKPIKDHEARVEVLRSRLDSLSKEIPAQQKLVKAVDQRTPESPFAREWGELESQRTRLDALESEKLNHVQLVKERKELTASIADAISNLPG